MSYSSSTRFVDSIIPPVKRQERIFISQIAGTRPLKVQESPASRTEIVTSGLLPKLGKSVLSFVSIIAALVIAGGGSLILVSSAKGIILQTVLSGSMNPTLPTGSVSMLVPKTIATGVYSKGEIIAFKNKEGTTVTHRIIDVRQEDDGAAYQTQGDANPVPDATLIPHQAVLGRSVFGLPYLGYFLGALRTKIGFTIFILIPASLLAIYELKRMWEAFQQIRLRRLGQRRKSWGSRLVPSAMAVSVMLALITIPTFTLLTDTVTISPNSVSVAALIPSPSPTPTPTPTPTSSPEPSPEPTASPEPTNEPCELGDITVDQENSNTGEGSTNENTVDIDQNCEENIHTETTISNTIDITANTGNNSSSDNTEDGSITTGDVSIDLNISNN